MRNRKCPRGRSDAPVSPKLGPASLVRRGSTRRAQTRRRQSKAARSAARPRGPLGSTLVRATATHRRCRAAASSDRAPAIARAMAARAQARTRDRARASRHLPTYRRRFRPETAVSRQHLVQHNAERPDIGALIDGFAASLLGAHVSGGAENSARLRHAKGERRRDRRTRSGGRIFSPRWPDRNPAASRRHPA